MTLEIEQQLVGIKDENRKVHWQPRPPKSKAGYRTIPFGNALTEILKLAKKGQLENLLKYGELYKQVPDMIMYVKKKMANIVRQVPSNIILEKLVEN